MWAVSSYLSSAVTTPSTLTPAPTPTPRPQRPPPCCHSNKSCPMPCRRDAHLMRLLSISTSLPCSSILLAARCVCFASSPCQGRSGRGECPAGPECIAGKASLARKSTNPHIECMLCHIRANLHARHVGGQPLGALAFALQPLLQAGPTGGQAVNRCLCVSLRSCCLLPGRSLEVGQLAGMQLLQALHALRQAGDLGLKRCHCCGTGRLCRLHALPLSLREQHGMAGFSA